MYASLKVIVKTYSLVDKIMRFANIVMNKCSNKIVNIYILDMKLCIFVNIVGSVYF